MRLNPEFRRNLWLETSVQRLVAMPAILGALFYLVHLTDDAPNALGDFCFWVYCLLVLLWGTRLAASSVVTEVREGTWDWQRMSSIGPWQMAWGKLFGSTVFVWYGALIALAVGLVSESLHGEPRAVSRLLFIGLAGGMLAHAVGLSASLLWLRRGAASKRSVLFVPQLLGLLAGGSAVYQGLSAIQGETAFSDVQVWYGLGFERGQFVMGSLAVFLAWSILGVYRLMQAELQVRRMPWAWPAFVLFLMVYYAGLATPSPGGIAFADGVFLRLLLAFGVALLLAYVSAFLFPKDAVALRALSLALKARDAIRALRLLPPWLIVTSIAGLAGLAVIAAMATLSQAAPTGARVYRTDFLLAGILLVAGTFGYLLRDLGLVLFLHLRGTARRADAAALVYLLVLHVLVPGLMAAGGLMSLVGLVSPFAYLPWRAFGAVAPIGLDSEYFAHLQASMDVGSWLVLTGAAVQVALVLVVLVLRWRRLQSEFETSLAHEAV